MARRKTFGQRATFAPEVAAAWDGGDVASTVALLARLTRQSDALRRRLVERGADMDTLDVWANEAPPQRRRPRLIRFGGPGSTGSVLAAAGEPGGGYVEVHHLLRAIASHADIATAERLEAAGIPRSGLIAIAEELSDSLRAGVAGAQRPRRLRISEMASPSDEEIEALLTDPECPWVDSQPSSFKVTLRLASAPHVAVTEPRVIPVAWFMAFARSRGYSSPALEELTESYIRRSGGSRQPVGDPERRVRNAVRRVLGHPTVGPEYVWLMPTEPQRGRH